MYSVFPLISLSSQRGSALSSQDTLTLRCLVKNMSDILFGSFHAPSQHRWVRPWNYQNKQQNPGTFRGSVPICL